MNTFALRGNILFSTNKTTLETHINSYLVCENGLVGGVFENLPDKYKSIKVIDYRNSLIIPGLVDLHLHAPQYNYRGTGMDLELLDWLERYTFPEEAKYKDIDYAKKGYEIFVNDIKKGATTRACIFATIHPDATIELMKQLEDIGVNAYVGKVNMDRNAPEYLNEKTAEQSLKNTVEWLEKVKQKNFKNVKPILTPRFTPTCSDELMCGLGDIAKEQNVAVQSHLSENISEIEWVKALCPSCKNYAESYSRYGMFGENSKTIMAHCVHCPKEEIELMKKNNVFVAHCPQSNINVSSGIAPVRQYIDAGLKIGLGSDIAGGTDLSIFKAMSDAIGMSKIYWRLVDDKQQALTLAEAFYLATKGGGEFFGKVGSFEEGYEFDAVVLDDSDLKSVIDFDITQRLERFVYLGNEKIKAKFILGEKII